METVTSLLFVRHRRLHPNSPAWDSGGQADVGEVTTHTPFFSRGQSLLVLRGSVLLTELLF